MTPYPRSRNVITALTLIRLQAGPSGRGHAVRSSRCAGALTRQLGLPASDIRCARLGALLHDVGKVGIPDAILYKAGPLRRDEVELVRLHTVIGDALCSATDGLSDVRLIVRHHHERLDGSGYPDGLARDAIPLLAQVVGIVDAYDALTSERSYRLAWRPERAFRQLQEEARRGWRRPDLVDEFVRLGREGGLAHPGRG